MNASQQAQVEELYQVLRERGVSNPDLLAVFNLGAGEQIIGEIDELAHTSPMHPTTVKNPKRLLRLQQVTNGGLTISFYIGDMDLVTGGECAVSAPLVYRMSWLDAESRLALLRLYIEYTDRRVTSRAQEAGLVTPGTGLVRGT